MSVVTSFILGLNPGKNLGAIIFVYGVFNRKEIVIQTSQKSNLCRLSFFRKFYLTGLFVHFFSTNPVSV